MALLTKLTKFYRNEEKRLPHSEADIWDLAWDLAELLESEGEHSNAWKGPSNWEFDDFINALKTQPSVLLIDTAVDSMHQSLLDIAGDDSDNLLFQYLSQNIRQYLLRRNDDTAWQEAEEWQAEEEEKMAELDTLEEEYWQIFETEIN